MHEACVVVSNRLGVHARAAAKIVNITRTFTSSVTITDESGTRKANAASILDILALAAGQGTRLTISATGCDEVETIDAVVRAFNDKFGEE